jgi:hypothetical protein
MAVQKTLLQYICSVLLLASAASALKFDLIAQAESSKRERCVRNFVGKDTLVVVTATVDGYKGDGMVVNLYVRCAQMHMSYKAELIWLYRFEMPLATSTVGPRTLSENQGPSLHHMPTLPLMSVSRILLLVVCDSP